MPAPNSRRIRIMNERLDSFLHRFEELSLIVQNPDLAKDPKKYRDVMREYSHLGEIAAANDDVKNLSGQLEDTKSLVQNEKDPEMKELAKEEIRDLEIRLSDAED